MLNNTLVNKQDITIETKKYLETNGNNNKTTQNLGNSAKAVLRWKFIAIQFYLKKQEKSQENNLSLPKLFLVRKRRTKSKVSTSKDMLKIREEINEMETKHSQRSMKLKAGSLRK